MPMGSREHTSSYISVRPFCCRTSFPGINPPGNYDNYAPSSWIFPVAGFPASVGFGRLTGSQHFMSLCEDPRITEQRIVLSTTSHNLSLLSLHRPILDPTQPRSQLISSPLWRSEVSPKPCRSLPVWNSRCRFVWGEGLPCWCSALGSRVVDSDLCKNLEIAVFSRQDLKDISDLAGKLQTCVQHSHGLQNLYRNLSNREARGGGTAPQNG